MHVACFSGRLFAKLVNSMEAKKPLLVPAKSSKIPLKMTPGLSSVGQANLAEEMTILLTPLTSERFTLSKSVTKKLKVQLGMYFKATGIANKSCLGMMTENSSWTVPESFATETEALKQLKVPGLLLLKKLGTYSI